MFFKIENLFTLFSLFLYRHVLLVMFITFSWIVWIRSACVSPPRTTFARFELTDHASNQVESCLFSLVLIFAFFFFQFAPVNRRALPDMCGTRVILKDANPWVHATRLEIISPNFSSIRRVEQVSVYKLCTRKINPTKIFNELITSLLDDGFHSSDSLFLPHSGFLTHCALAPVLPFWNALHNFTYYSQVLKY